jgi:hypothetical protein
MREHLRSASTPYSSRFATAKEEIIGEWLKENTITGIASHSVIHRPLPVAFALLKERVSSALVLHCGIRYSASIISDHEREHQNTHRFDNHLLTETHDGHHADNQNQRQDGARRRVRATGGS